MRIGQSFAPAGLGPRRGVERRSGDSGFAARVGGGATLAGRNAVGGPAPLASLNAVLAVQEVDDPLVGRGKLRRRGEHLLDALDDVRLALLEGRLPAGKLAAIRQLATERRGRSDDPGLDAILDEIELRAAVELAKLERATG